jgi:hypothetical protein
MLRKSVCGEEKNKKSARREFNWTGSGSNWELSDFTAPIDWFECSIL